MANVTVKNVGRLTRKLNNIADMELRDVVVEATKLVHGQAVNNAVFEKGYTKGLLRESIKMEVNKTKDSYEGRVYTNVEYAPYVEFGTGTRGNGSYPYTIEGLDLSYHESWVGMEAQPYMYPALKMHEKHINKLFKDGVKTKLVTSCKGGK